MSMSMPATMPRAASLYILTCPRHQWHAGMQAGTLLTYLQIQSWWLRRVGHDLISIRMTASLLGLRISPDDGETVACQKYENVCVDMMDLC
jgi:hypothetical protein